MPPLDTSSDVDLMRLFIAGDEGAFEALVIRYEEPLLNFFFRLTRNRQAAEDLTQETFLRVMRARDSYTVKATFRTYLYRIARNLWIDRYRSLRGRPKPLSLDARGPDGSDGSVAERLEGQAPRPGERLELAETHGLLEAAIAELPGSQKEVFVLWLETGMKYAEISKVLDIPVGTIKSRMHTATHRLKEALRRHMER